MVIYSRGLSIYYCIAWLLFTGTFCNDGIYKINVKTLGSMSVQLQNYIIIIPSSVITAIKITWHVTHLRTHFLEKITRFFWSILTETWPNIITLVITHSESITSSFCECLSHGIPAKTWFYCTKRFCWDVLLWREKKEKQMKSFPQEWIYLEREC